MLFVQILQLMAFIPKIYAIRSSSTIDCFYNNNICHSFKFYNIDVVYPENICHSFKTIGVVYTKNIGYSLSFYNIDGVIPKIYDICSSSTIDSFYNKNICHWPSPTIDGVYTKNICHSSKFYN